MSDTGERMKKIPIIFLFVIIVLPVLSGFAIADDTAEAEDTHFMFVIDNNRLTSISPDMVISSPQFIIVEDYLVVNVNYTALNGTIIKSGTVNGNVIKLSKVDGAHLIIKDKQNNIIMETTIHEMNVANFFTYVFPMQYQQLVLTVVFAFIASIIIVVAFYVNKETRIL